MSVPTSRAGVDAAGRPRGRSLRGAAGWLGATALGTGLVWIIAHGLGDRAAHVGAALFDGGLPLAARIDGHSDALPPQTAACANCHHARAVPVAVGGSTVASVGPRLHRQGLTATVSRRGGPPSRFEEQSFCRLLRTGEDPAGVLLPRAMPRYEIDDMRCHQLWRHLMRVPQ